VVRSHASGAIHGRVAREASGAPDLGWAPRDRLHRAGGGAGRAAGGERLRRVGLGRGGRAGGRRGVAVARAAMGGERESGVLQGERVGRRRGAGDGAGGARLLRRVLMARYLIAMTGASGSAYGVDFVRRCPGEKFLVLSDWARKVLHDETGLKPSDLESSVKKVFADSDLAAPFSSGSNRYDALV